MPEYRRNRVKTTLCHKHGCFCAALEGKHYCSRHIGLEASWGRRTMPERKRSRAWHGLYASARWRRESREFLSEFPYCAVCGQPASVVDHIVPHRGDESIFFDRRNWQPLCHAHHGAKTMRENDFFRKKTNGEGG